METVVSLYGIQPLRIGGVETLVRETTLQLEKIGWRHVVVFSSKPVDIVERYLRHPNLTIEFVDNLEMSGRDSLPGAIRVLRKYNAGIVHLSFLHFIGPLPWIARLCGARKVFFTDQSSASADFEPRRAPHWKRVAARIINYPIHQVFNVSDFNRRMMVATGLIDPGRCFRLHNSIYLPPLEQAAEQAHAFRRRFGIADDRELVAQVSWIIPEKGVPEFLEAARLVREQRPRAHFVLVGDGAYLNEYQERARSLGLDGAVTWTGLLESPMDDGVYAAADVFCLPSRWQEAFGWVITEAMSFEKPVVASAIGGIPEIIDDNVTGYLVPSGSVQDLASRILCLLADPEKRRRMGQAARRAVAERFELTKAVERMISFYRK